MAYRGEFLYNMAGQTGSMLGGASVESSNMDSAKLQVGNRYRIEFVAKGVQGGAVPWTPRFASEIEVGLAQRGIRAKVIKITQGTFTPTSGSAVLDWTIDWVPGAGTVLPSRDLLGNFTFSLDIDILGKGQPPAYLQPEDYDPRAGTMRGLGIVPVVAVYIGLGIVAGVVALSVLAPSIVVKSISNLGKAAGEGVTAALKGLGPVGIAAVAAGIFLWMKYSKKGQAVKSKVFG